MKYRLRISYNHKSTAIGPGIPPNTEVLPKVYDNIFEAKRAKELFIKHNDGCSFTIIEIKSR